jgi:hypothetical protein
MVRYHEMTNENRWTEDDEEEKEQKIQFNQRLKDNLHAYYSYWEDDEKERSIRFQINDDNSVEILTSCHLSHSCISLPYANITVCKGDFIMANQGVRSLKYTPKKILGEFSCGHNDFISLTDGPVSVSGNYACEHNNKLESLEGLATEIGGDLDFNGCKKLKVMWNSFDSIKVGGNIYIPYHINLPLLRLLAPTYANSKIQVLLFDIADLEEIHDILAKYFNVENWKKAVVDCQYELIKSGYKGNAKW